MALNTLPPPPINDKPGSFTWLEWYRQLRNYVSTSGSVPWYIINFSGSSIQDLAERSHQKLQELQGGAAGEQYHITREQSEALDTGYTGTVALAKLTTGGTAGSLTVSNGIITAYTAPT